MSEKKKSIARKSLYTLFFKRFFDVLISGLALIVLSPVFLIVSIVCRIKMGKGIIFKNYRPGKNNKIFKLYKYRSMLNTRDANGELLPDRDRMTKFGNMLRKTSLDELPQLWNIFVGHMSIIGPRPKLVKDMVFYNDEQNVRSLVRPGLTGLAQVNGRNNITWEEVFEYDKYYVEHCSLWLDIKIFFKTIAKVFKKADIVEQDKTKQAYYYGDYLLESGVVTKEEYNTKQELAKNLIDETTKRRRKNKGKAQ
ncbi:MAG: sugar transferase [Clostridia bacterium]|nr:sugar transferase [Clostridia bacterium]